MSTINLIDGVVYTDGYIVKYTGRPYKIDGATIRFLTYRGNVNSFERFINHMDDLVDIRYFDTGDEIINMTNDIVVMLKHLQYEDLDIVFGGYNEEKKEFQHKHVDFNIGKIYNLHSDIVIGDDLPLVPFVLNLVSEQKLKKDMLGLFCLFNSEDECLIDYFDENTDSIVRLYSGFMDYITKEQYGYVEKCSYGLNKRIQALKMGEVEKGQEDK